MTNIIQEFQSEIKKIESLTCKEIIGGSGTGSIINVKIGIPNSSIGYDLFIQCVWRLDSPEKVVCGAWSNNKKGQSMLRGLNKIVGQKIISVQLSQPSYSLSVCFENNYTLHIFCDQIGDDPALGDNYCFFTPEYVYSVELNCTIQKEDL